MLTFRLAVANKAGWMSDNLLSGQGDNETVCMYCMLLCITMFIVGTNVRTRTGK